MNPLIADISHWDDNPQTPNIKINWSLMASKLDGVIVKVGQGLAVDPLYGESWTKSKTAGMLRGSYWFFDNHIKPAQQAELYFALLGNDLGELPLCADLESRKAGPYYKWDSWFVFLSRLRELVGEEKEILIYTTASYWIENTIQMGIKSAQLDWFGQFPFWVAHYDVVTPKLAKPWDTWLFWQFTKNADGSLYGVEAKSLDLSYYNGTQDEYQKRYGKEHQTERDVAYLRKAGREAKYKRI